MSQQRERDTVAMAYRKAFGVSAELHLAAPGRVNLIGEHTDYNEGYVFPAAIDRRINGAFSRRNDNLVRLRSLDFKEAVEFSLTDIRYDKNDPWGNYPRGIAQALQKRGIALCGMQGVIKSEIPVGSGLSSSAALEMIIGKALLPAVLLLLSAFATIPAGINIFRYFKGIVLPAQLLARGLNFIGTQWRAVYTFSALLVGRTKPNHCLTTNKRWTGRVSTSRFDSRN